MRKQDEQNKYVTVNTFSRMPSLAQICSYSVVVIQTVVFYLMVRPNIISHKTQIVLTVLFTISLTISIISSFLCSFIDPSDSIMMQCKRGNRQKLQHNLNQLLFCDYCQSYVTNQARHCRQCDRCVQKFDHHCMWINNCVGFKNYKMFIIMIISNCLHLSFYIVAVAILSYQNRWHNFIGFIITSWVVLSIVGVLWFLLFNLNLLHLYLICKGYTTYQFIMARRDQKQKKQTESKQKQSKQSTQKINNQIFSINNGNNSDQNSSTSEQHIKKISKQIKIQQDYTNSKIIMNDKISTDKKYKPSNCKYCQKQIICEQISQQIKPTSNQSNQLNYQTNHLYQSKPYYPNNNLQDRQSLTQGNQSIKISQFFTKNRSFSLMISNQNAQKPRKRLTIHNSLNMDNKNKAKILDFDHKRDKKSQISKYQTKKIVPSRHA